jgi:hypothetical protein
MMTDLIRAAHAVPTAERYNVTRVWISDAYTSFHRVHPDVDFERFAALLVEANQARTITLARCDMPHALTKADLAKEGLSEIRQGSYATFHWIRIPAV